MPLVHLHRFRDGVCDCGSVQRVEVREVKLRKDSESSDNKYVWIATIFIVAGVSIIVYFIFTLFSNSATNNNVNTTQSCNDEHNFTCSYGPFMTGLPLWPFFIVIFMFAMFQVSRWFGRDDY